MATPQVKDLVLRSPAGSSEVVTFSWPLQIGHGQDKHDNGIDIIDTIKFVCEELPGISSAFEEVNLNNIDTACYKTMTNLVDRFNKAVDSIVALEKGTSLPTERLNKFADPSLLRHILQLVYNAAVSDPDKLNNYEPFSPEVYGETSYELVQQMIKHVAVNQDDTFIDLGSGVGQVVLQMAGSFPLKTCIGIEKADTPVRYAQRMDIFFRQYMAWFGKRFCEYKLLKGDFLVDEHREKITSSTLVFVNNFAFGPNVDHQLKERFADLRDGARIVSSKSFCPLNFRITDRNLSDIGTIMHLSEIPPLKGSVSWTCKPVSYYLHVIDRTILERYFQRMKNHKGPEHNEHVGSTRTTRDRAKREANHQNHNNNHANSVNNSLNANNSSSSNTPTMNSNSNSTGSTTTNAQNGKSSTKMDESSTDSEAEAAVVGTTPATTRRTWSDWCSSKGKSSQSDDEENNNFSSTTNSRNIRAATQKRKKLTRKAAIASKSAAAAAAAQAAAEKIAAAAAQKESGNLAAPNAVGGAKRKGRMKKGGGGRGKKNLKIVGLDVLHTQTLLSTSAEMMCKKLPPAPGCVDQQLTSLTGDMSHTELDIPQAPSDTPYALQIILDVFRQQYLTMIDNMKSKSFVPNLKRKIQLEQERKQRIKNRASQLDKQIKVLIDDSVALLKARMNELGINMSSPNDLLAKAKEIVGRHKELQGMVKKMSSQVTAGEIEQKRLLKKNLHSFPEFAKLSKQKNGTSETLDISEAAAHDLLLKEIANTLVQRKKLYAQVSTIEKESITLEKVVEERKTAATLLAQGTNLTIATSTAPATVTTLNSTITTIGKSGHTKSSRRSRDHRTRSQEWPDVPDVGKIEESNPEVLAQKILETGRQIEAGKIPSYKHKDERANKHRSSSSEHNTHHHQQFIAHHSGPDSALMPAPPQGGLKQQQQQIPIVANHVPLNAGGGRTSSKSSKNHQESPKVANFEDRLKSIITSALNEDQEHRKSQHPPVEAVAPPPPVSPAKKSSSKSSSNTHHHQQTAQQQMHHHHLSNIITVATQGLTHLNSTTTISPITPPLQQHHYAHGVQNHNGPIHHMHHHSQTMPPTAHSGYKSSGAIPPNIGSSYSKQSTSSSSISSSTSLSAASGSASSSSSAHHQQHQKYSKSNAPSSSSASSIERGVSIHPLHGHNQHHPAQLQQPPGAHQHAALYAAATDLAFRRSYEHHYQEFKAPENMNRGLVEEPTRSHSASSDSAMYFPPTRDRLLSLDRSQQQQPMQQPSRPSSSSSQPDYTQVSPAKMALRRHLSQEKLANQHVGPANASSGSVMASKTIGDLVNGEIERTLEISHQSIINAVVNMSTGSTTTPSTTERPIINPNAQRPERVHVRVLDEISTQQSHSASQHPQQHHHTHHPYNQISPRSRSDGNMSEIKKSPAHNLTTLAQVAYNQKMISKQQQQPSSSSSAGRPPHGMGYNTSAGYQQQLHSMPPTTAGGASGTLAHPSPTSSSSKSSNSKRDYSKVALPRAEMKPCLESYFNEEPKSTTAAAPISMKERISNRRMNGNPPLEGLAVSLQDHVMASRKFKEESEERQRRSELAAAHFQNSNIANTPSTVHPLIQHHERTSPIKVEIGMKRTSPITHHPRPSKMPHFASHEHLMATNSNTNSSTCSSTNNGRISNSSLEPPLMSPEINSLMADERPLQMSSRPRTTDDDDVIPDDETHWQDRVSSGFDRLVAFASTELDKTRRSIDTDTAPSISCNTSPDSGIAHSSNSEARTFLSTSSSSSQLDIGAHTDPMSDSSTKSSHDVIPISKSSLVDDAIESPPLSDIGLPRTPSPSAVTPPLGSLLFPHQASTTVLQAESNATSRTMTSASSSTSSSSTTQPGLKIPLKYQRKSKTSSEKHYKKKFCERNWGFEDETIYGSGDGAAIECNGILTGANNSLINNHRKEEVSAMHHKASKFRPKGKDWDWSVESKSKGGNVTTASSSTVVGI